MHALISRDTSDPPVSDPLLRSIDYLAICKSMLIMAENWVQESPNTRHWGSDSPHVSSPITLWEDNAIYRTLSVERLA